MFGATPVARSDERSAAVSSEQLTRLTLEQALDADYVFDATRGEDLYQPAKVVAKDAEEEEPEMHQGKGVLVSTVLAESRTEHLTSGFMGSVRDREAHQVMARLARELAALGLSADTSYQTLTNKRAIMLSRLYAAYEADHRKHKAASSRRRRFDASPLSPMVEIGVSAGVHTMLSILAHSAVQDHPLCMNLLLYLQSKLINVPAMAFSLGADSTAAELSLETFDAIHDTLLACATLPLGGAKGTTQEIRDRSLELLLAVAVTRGSLSYFLSVVNLLLHATQDGKKSVAIRGLLRKLRAVQRESVLDLPSPKKLDGFVAIPDLGTGWSTASTGSMATDGTYLYLHNHGGLFKIGTGFNGTTPGTIYGQIKGWRGGESSAMVCLGDRLYYRSANIYPLLFSVISTQHLTEIGSIRRDGAGSVATPDLSWYFPLEEDEKKEEKGDLKEGKMERDGKSSDVRPTLLAPTPATSAPRVLTLSSSSSSPAPLVTPIAGTAAAVAGAATATSSSLFGANRLKPLRGTIFGDGTFLYALQPRPIGEKPAVSATPIVAAATPLPSVAAAIAATAAASAAVAAAAATAATGFATMVATQAAVATVSGFNFPPSPSPFGMTQPAHTGFFGAPSPSTGFSFGPSPPPQQQAFTGFGSSSLFGDSSSNTGGWGSPSPSFSLPVPTPAAGALLPALPSTDPKQQRGEYAIQVFEPSRGFEHCHSTILYRPLAEGKNNTVLHFKSNQVADPTTGRRPAYAMLTLGNPEHLNFAGSVTLECWIKIPREVWALRGTIGLFYHGDGRSNLYMYISSHQLYIGYQGTTGNQAAAVMISSVDTAEWFHVAGIYDQATQQFRLHVNGAMLRSQAAGVGPERSTGNWFVGSSTAGHIFTGAMAEVRIWKSARTEDQLRAGMRTVPAADADSLVGYWPLNDGLGLRVTDVSTNKHQGSLRTCQWQDEKRPFEHPKQRHSATAVAAAVVSAVAGAPVTGAAATAAGKDEKKSSQPVDSKLIPYDFSHQALPQTVCYANGESFAIIYPAKVVAIAFDGAQNQSGMAARQDAVVQVFSIATGMMIYESENDYLADAIASVTAPTADAVWLQSLKEPAKLNRFTIRPPSTISKWRLDRMKEEQTAGFPTARQLGDRYKLSSIGEQGDHRDRRRGKPLTEAVEIHQATMAILARLEQDCSLTSQPDAGDAPNSLSLPLAVEASKRTFQSLLELAELLSADYYKSEKDLKAKYDKNTELRLFAFLVTLRLLRTNIVHVVGWNVDPTECGFANDLNPNKKKNDDKKKEQDVKDGESKDGDDEEEEKEVIDDDEEDDEFMKAVADDAIAEEKKKPAPLPAAAAMHTRYTSLLNKLILDAPIAPVAKLIAPRIHEEVCESLSVGMSVFFGVASERVTILGELVNGALARYTPVKAGQAKPVVNPLRLLLMNRYFGKLAQPRNVISIVPALTVNPNAAAITAVVPAKGKTAGAAPVVVDDHKGSPLLIDVFTLALNASQERLEKYFAGEITDPWATGEQKDGIAKDKKQLTASDIADKADQQAPLEFLQKLQLVLLARLAHQSRTSVEYRYAMDYALHVITKVANLLSYCLTAIDKLNTRETTSVTVAGKKYDVISAKSFCARTLQEGVGSVVVPLLTGIWSVNLGAESAARLVQPLYGLLSQADRLCSGMPDIVAREAQSVEGRGQRVQVSRSVTVESQHPCPAGLCEKLLSVPGAKEMKVTIDQRTFPGTQGTSVAFYRKAGQNDAIEGANFNRNPGKPFEVQGDSVYIVFNPGFNPNSWGFLATATAMVEEVKVEVPYCLDVAKAASLLAGKCTIWLVRGETTQPAEIEAAKLLANELLSEGIEVDDILDKKEDDQLSWLPKSLVHVAPVIAAPPALVRATSGQAAASVAALVSELTAKLTSNGVTAGAFPVPDGAKDSVARAIGSVHAVLIKHNGLLRDAAAYVAGTLSRDNSDSLIRVWKTAFKLRQWFLQRYQEIRSAAKEEANIDKVEVYETLCKQVIQRCSFLVDLVPVPRPDQKEHHDEKVADLTKPGLVRQASKEAGEQSEADKKARATLLVWKSTKETGKLRDAHTDDERLSLVWKLVFSFISATDMKLEMVRDAMAVRRRRTRTRARGLAIMKDLLEAVSLSSLKREVIASLVPALHVNDASLYAGQPADPLQALSSGGRVLQGQTRSAFHAIFTSLARILFTPTESGAPLLQATLHAFSLQYTDDDFQLLEKLKIFPGLHKLLSSGGDDDTAASRLNATAHTSAWALLDLLTTAILSNPDLEVVQVAGAPAPEHGKLEPIYVILEAQLTQIATTLQRELLRDEETKPASTGTFGGVAAGTMGFGNALAPRLPSLAQPLLAPAGAFAFGTPAAAPVAVNPAAAAVALKMNTITAFGMEQGKDAGAASVDGEFMDAFNIKVLNLVDKIARLSDGRQRVSDRMMPSLLRIMKSGSPRARVVVMRILRRLWTGTEAPSLKRCDIDMAASDPKKDDAKDGKDGKAKDDDKKATPLASIESGSPDGDTTVRWFLRHIGQAMLAPSFTALALNEQALRDERVKTVIRQLKLSPLYSTDSVSVWSEEVMLLRHLAGSSPSWHKILDSNAITALKSLPTVLAQFRKYHERCTANNGRDRAAADIELATNPFLWDDAYLLIGVLNVLGGYIDSIRVGARVHVLPDGPIGTVVARTGTNVRVIRDEEGTVSVTTLSQVVCLSDIPFSPSLIAGLDGAQLLATIVPVLDSICSYANELPDFDGDGLSAAPTVGLTVFSTLYTRVIRLAHSLCLTPSTIQTLVTRHPTVLRSLYRTALAPRFESGQSAAVVEDTAAVTGMEMIRRARLPVPIVATIKRIGSMPTVTLNIQNGDSQQSHIVLGTRLGKKIEDNQSIKAQLSYVRFNEAPHADKCADKLVLLDTYNPLSSSFRLRAKQCADLGARAVILALSKPTAKEEGIGEETAEDEKKMKAMADEEKKRARAGVNVVEAARTAALAAMTAAAATPAPATERKERKAAVNAFTQAAGGAAAATAEDAATAAATAAAITGAATSGVDEKRDEAKEAEIKKLEDDLKGIPFVCVPQAIGLSLRTLLGVRDSEQPEILYRNSLKDRLLTAGHSLQHSERALTKSNWDIHGAEKWLTDNAGWLKNAELLGELETEEMKDNDRREQAAKEKSEQEGISFADALAIIKAEEGEDSEDSDGPSVSSSSTRGGRGGARGGRGGRGGKASRASRGAGLFDDESDGDSGSGSGSSSDDDDDDMPVQSARGLRRPVVVKPVKPPKDKKKDGKDDKKDKKGKVEEEEEDEGDLLLEDAWLSFVTATRTKIQVAAEQEAAARLPTFQSPFLNHYNEQTSVASSPSHRLVDRVISNDGYIMVAYARRILTSALEHWPRTVPLAFFGPHEHLLSTLHMAMTLDIHQAGELQPEQHLKARDFRRQLLRNLVVEALQPTRAGYLAGVIQNDVAMQLESITIPTTNNPRPVKVTAAAKKKAQAAKARAARGTKAGVKAIIEPDDKKKQKAKHAALNKRVLAAVNPSSKPVLVQLKLEGATSLSFTFEIKTKIKVPTINVSFYRSQAGAADELLEQVVLSADAKKNAYVSAQVCGGQVWYAATADGFDSKTHGDTNVVILAERGQGSGNMTALGSLDTALTFIDVLLCVRQPAATVQRMLQLLLRALPWVNDKAKAQAFCHTASMLFARWKDIRSDLSAGEVTEMASRVIQLERAHGSLRRATMVNWNNGGLPSPHLQTLLELILAARRALPESSLPKPVFEAMVTPGKRAPSRSPTAGGSAAAATAARGDAKKGEAMKNMEETKMKSDDDKEEKKGRTPGDGDDDYEMPEVKVPDVGSKDEKDEKGESKDGDDEKKMKEKAKDKGSKEDQKEQQRQKNLGLFPAPPPNEHMIDSFRRHRDGEPLCALISLGQKEILDGLHIGGKKGGGGGGAGGGGGGAQAARRRGNYGYDDGYNDDPYYDGTVQTYVGAGSVKGGKWYYEVTITARRPQALCIGWVTRDYLHSGNHLSNDYSGQQWCIYGPNNQYYHRSKQVGVRQNVPSQIGHWEPGTVIGVLVDMDKRIMNWSFDGVEEPTPPYTKWDIEGGLYPALSVGKAECQVNFGRFKFQYPPDAKKHPDWSPFEHPAIRMSSWLERYMHAYDVTQLVYARSSLPEKVVEAVLEQELMSLERDNDMPFELVDYDKPPTGQSATGTPTGLLIDSATQFYPHTAKNFHISFKVSTSQETSFYLREVRVRCQQGAPASGLVFVSTTKPDYDSFEWCNDFQAVHYKRWLARKKSSLTAGQPLTFGAHEPVGCITTDKGSDAWSTCKLEIPIKGAYITLKLSEDAGNGLGIEFIRFSVVHGEHPLGGIITAALIAEKTREIGVALRSGARWGEAPSSLSLPLLTTGEKKEDSKEVKVDATALALATPASGQLTAAGKDAAGGWTLSMDEALVAMLQSIASRLGIAPAVLDAVVLSPTANDLGRFPQLETVPVEALRSRSALLKYLNKVNTPLLHYVDITTYEKDSKSYLNDPALHEDVKIEMDAAKADTSSSSSSAGSDEKKETKAIVPASSPKAGSSSATAGGPLLTSSGDDASLSFVVHRLKGLFFISTKRSVFEALLAQILPPEGTYTAPRITINRIRAAKMKETPAKDPTGQSSVFGQIFNQLRSVPAIQLRASKKDQQMWNVTFLGEGSVDVGGPYRESLTNMCADLMSVATPLFIRSANGRNSVGLNREKWVPNPSANTPLHLSMYEFVGVLMGLGMTSKFPLSLDFPSIVWKGILGQTGDRADLEGIDKLCMQAMAEVSHLPRDSFAQAFSEKFVTQLTDNTEVELKKDGRLTTVTYENRNEFIDLVIKTRLNESTRQLQAIQKGLGSVVPLRMLGLFSCHDLEVLVCGNPYIDIEALRRHTVFAATLSAGHPLVKFFFDALHSFNMEERQLFLRFVWGRNRLPATDNDWSTNFTLNHLTTASDESLPISHTCFFSIDLPNYSSLDTMKKKLLYAIYNCTAIDVDFNPNASQLQAWVD